MHAALSNELSLEGFGDIRTSLQRVQQLRIQVSQSNDLREQVQALKRWQSERFAQAYTDLRRDPALGEAIGFFLTELYSSADYSRRDAQFARIASKLEKLFPASVVSTATRLARLHALSETLDVALAQQLGSASIDEPSYRAAWYRLAQHSSYTAARAEQLQAVIELGHKLSQHTRTPGLRMMLSLMRKPAAAAGLSQLQHFLERGFDTFGQLCKQGKTEHFLSSIEQREHAWIASLNRESDAGQPSA